MQAATRNLERTSPTGSRGINWTNRLMKPIAVLYATREGHSERIADRVARDLCGHGFSAEVKNLRDTSGAVKLSDYSAVVLAASVHAGKHEPEMVKFVKNHRAGLDALPTLVLSVTLSQAGAEMPALAPEVKARFSSDVQKTIEKFVADTGWRPKCIKPVAGALVYSKYNPLVKFVMKRIARKAGAGTDTSRDYDYTNWEALDRYADDFAEQLSAIAAEARVN